MRDGDRSEHDEDIRRNAGEPHHYVGQHHAVEQIDRVEAGGGNPLQIFRGMVHGATLPERMAVEELVRPIKDEVLADQKNDHLRDQRQRGERAATILIERDQPVGGGDAEQDGGDGDVSELGQLRSSRLMRRQHFVC